MSCCVISLPRKRDVFIFFSANKESLSATIWSEGTIYILPEETFHSTTSGEIRFDEWASEQAAPVVAKLQISPEDFPLPHQITGHAENESIFTIWLKYKERLHAG